MIIDGGAVIEAGIAAAAAAIRHDPVGRRLAVVRDAASAAENGCIHFHHLVGLRSDGGVCKTVTDGGKLLRIEIDARMHSGGRHGGHRADSGEVISDRTLAENVAAEEIYSERSGVAGDAAESGGDDDVVSARIDGGDGRDGITRGIRSTDRHGAFPPLIRGGAGSADGESGGISGENRERRRLRGDSRRDCGLPVAEDHAVAALRDEEGAAAAAGGDASGERDIGERTDQAAGGEDGEVACVLRGEAGQQRYG